MNRLLGVLHGPSGRSRGKAHRDLRQDLIIWGGQNIYPVEIENILINHPKVASVAVVGMPDPVLGEKACTYLAPKAGQTFTFEEMTAYLGEKGIAGFKLPERLEIIETMPMVGEGQKTDKKVLTQEIINKLKSEGVIWRGVSPRGCGSANNSVKLVNGWHPSLADNLSHPSLFRNGASVDIVTTIR